MVNKKKECQNCEDDTSELFELLGSVNCEGCWMEYWKDNEIGIDQSFNDFIGGLKKIK